MKPAEAAADARKFTRYAARPPEAPPRPTYVYARGAALYVNLTNRCPTACSFCVKRPWGWRFRGYDLKLGGHEPTASQVQEAIREISAKRSFKELVFCGYGESAYRLPVMMDVGQDVRRENPGLRRRLNTIGLGNLICGRSIAADLASCVDEVSVSVNTADPIQWEELHRPQAPYRGAGFAAVLTFIGECVASGLETTVTAVNLPGVNLPAVRRLARSLGARFRLRPLLGRPAGG